MAKAKRMSAEFQKILNQRPSMCHGEAYLAAHQGSAAAMQGDTAKALLGPVAADGAAAVKPQESQREGMPCELPQMFALCRREVPNGTRHSRS